MAEWIRALDLKSGGPWFKSSTLLLAGFVLGSPGITPQMELYNKAMSSVRMSVEWLFGDIVNYFKFLDFKRNLKISLSAVGKMYIVCAILRNALTSMYTNSTSEYFALDPATIEDYFS